MFNALQIIDIHVIVYFQMFFSVEKRRYSLIILILHVEVIVLVTTTNISRSVVAMAKVITVRAMLGVQHRVKWWVASFSTRKSALSIFIMEGS